MAVVSEFDRAGVLLRARSKQCDLGMATGASTGVEVEDRAEETRGSASREVCLEGFVTTGAMSVLGRGQVGVAASMIGVAACARGRLALRHDRVMGWSGVASLALAVARS
jgi:hypothetical protein